MSLDWDARTVEGIDNLTAADRIVMDTLIWASIPVGLSSITEDNAFEWFQRVSFYEKIAGAGMFTDYGKTPLFIQPGHIKRFIGLKTNVSPKTRAQFYRTMFEYHEDWKCPKKKFDEAEVIVTPDEEEATV